MGHRRHQDHYGRRAKSDGYAARSVYKLEEVNKRFGVIPRNGRVLDLGCSPGSWSDFVKQVGGADTRLVGIDLTEVGGYRGTQFVDSVFEVSIPEIREALVRCPEIKLRRLRHETRARKRGNGIFNHRGNTWVDRKPTEIGAKSDPQTRDILLQGRQPIDAIVRE